MEHSNDPFAPVWPKDEEIDLLSQSGKEQFRELESGEVEYSAPEVPVLSRAEIMSLTLNRAETLNLDTPDKVVEAAERFAAWISGEGPEAGETGVGTVSGVVSDVPPYLRD